MPSSPFAAWTAALLLCAASGPAVAQTSPAAGPIQVRTDHHLHVHSPAILGFLPGYCASPARLSPCDPAFTKPLTTSDLLSALDAAGIQRGWLMSTAYLAESPMMVPPAPDAAEILRTANDFTVTQAREHPDRLAAFIGVNPLSNTALPEIGRWRGDPAVTGIKLHLTNSGFDMRSPADVAKLAAVFGAAARDQRIIMIHMRTRALDYGARDVDIFLRDVLPAAKGGPVVIAHAGGWGGTNPYTLGALGAFADAIERDPSVGRNLWFDLAQVFDTKTGPDDLAALATLVRRIGVDRFVTGSDWPFAGDLASYYADTYPLLSLTSAEWDAIVLAGPEASGPRGDRHAQAVRGRNLFAATFRDLSPGDQQEAR